ncbi:MAG: hypothetical protein US53_C0016G0006 [Candidatus Woesebacteria bacterium GW2011_GWA1_37_7]|uniref:LTD domain-containing protein n=1 Tax=Candidatus Woesebacteria bacterium GW2011_GWA1_37_7 TaxID=1618545 RepID=A0A0G0H2Q0_9BACT|nr:MAG: hypothetical protein US53_C0016G0006 [Candidatus Woesebacteria bacterium GW2011_GWA1_37_7]
MYKLVFFLIFLLIFPVTVNAQVVINEFSSGSSHDDWVELYNSGTQVVNLSSYILRDSTDTNKVEIKNIQNSLEPDSYLVIDLKNYLNKDGDKIRLLEILPDNSVVEKDILLFGDKGGVCSPIESGTAGRYPDANNTIDRFKIDTKGGSNDSSLLDPCPTPTSLPAATYTPTPKPTATDKPTNTPKPISTINPKNTTTLKPVSTSDSTSNISSENEANGDKKNESEIVLGVKNDTNELSPTPFEEQVSRNKFPLLAGVFVFAGIVLIGGAIYPLIKNLKKL